LSQVLLCLVPRSPGVFVWLVFLPLVDAQTFDAGGPSPAYAPNPKFSLSGTVVNSVTGEPIRRALVQIYMGPEPAMLTDSNGKFEFSNLPSGQTSIAVRKPGFPGEQEMGRDGPTMADIGPDTRPLTLKLIPREFSSGGWIQKESRSKAFP
jgi:hypothetical protein